MLHARLIISSGSSLSVGFLIFIAVYYENAAKVGAALNAVFMVLW